jgi:hypothetical protein
MPDRLNGVGLTNSPLSRADLILALIDKVLADCEPELVQLRTAVENRPISR